MQGALYGLLASGSGDDTVGSALHDDYSQALMLAQQGTSLLEKYESSGALAELEEGINSLGMANGVIPENHPMKAAYLNDPGNLLPKSV
jgi:hypothetical protein